MDNTTHLLVNLTGNEAVDESSWPDIGFLLSGIYLTAVFFCSLVGNSLVLFLFAWDVTLRTPTNMFLLSITISDWLITVAGIPFVNASIYAHRWLFTHSGCIAYAFIMTFLGLNALLSHAAIAIDRYLVITKPHFGIVVTFPKALGMILVTWVWSLCWAVFPLAGWGVFTYEGTGAWCSVLWHSNRPDIIAYVMGMFVLTFGVSIAIMTYCYICIFLTMRRMPKWANATSFKAHTRHRRKREGKLLKTLLAIAVAFLFAWMPYSVTALMAVFGGPDYLSTTATTLPSLFAKGSVMINPIIYAVTSRVFRMSFKKAMTSICCPRFLQFFAHSTASSPANSQKTVCATPSRSDEKRKPQDDLSTSLLVYGGKEISASPKPLHDLKPEADHSPTGKMDGRSPATERAEGVGKRTRKASFGTSAKKSDKRTSVDIEMARLEKLMPGKHKRARASKRCASDLTVPEVRYKTVEGAASPGKASVLSNDDDEPVRQEGPDVIVETQEETTTELTFTAEEVLKELKYRLSDRGRLRSTSNVESGSRNTDATLITDKSDSDIVTEKEKKSRKAREHIAENDDESQSSLNADSGVFESCSRSNNANT